MTDIEFPSGFAHQTSPTLANKVMIDAAEYTTLDDLAALLATSGGLADAVKAGQLVGAQQITTNDLLDIASSLHISIGANYISLPAQTAESVHWIYSDVGCGLVPLGYPTPTQTINGVANIFLIGPGLHMLTGDGAVAWGVFDALGALAVTTGKVTDGAITLAKLNSDTMSLAQTVASLRIIDTNAPAAVGAAASAGSNLSVSASDHVHPHGSQTTTTDHATATNALNGFASSAHIATLEALAANAPLVEQIVSTSSATIANTTTLVRVTFGGAVTLKVNARAAGTSCVIRKETTNSGTITVDSDTGLAMNGGTVNASFVLPGSGQGGTNPKTDGEWLLSFVSSSDVRITARVYIDCIPRTGHPAGSILVADGSGAYADVYVTTAAMLPTVAAHTVLTRAANSTGQAAAQSVGTDEGLFNVAGVLTSQKVKLANIDAAVQSAAQGTESLRKIYTSTPAAIGTAAAGSSVQPAAGDHVHAHGAQSSDGTMHAVATTSAAGFMSAADKAELNALIDTADPLSAFTSYQTINVTGHFTDFLTPSTGSYPYSPFGSGTGNVSNWSAAVEGRAGLITIETGTTNTGSYYVGTNTAAISFGSGTYRWRSDLFVPTASDVTDTFIARAGFIDEPSGSPVDGCYFRYDYTENGGRWTCVTRANSVDTATVTDSGVAGVSATCQTLEIEVNAGATQVVYKINGSTVATHAANIPSGIARAVGCGVSITKSAGTTNRVVILDNMGDRFERTTAI